MERTRNLYATLIKEEVSLLKPLPKILCEYGIIELIRTLPLVLRGFPYFTNPIEYSQWLLFSERSPDD